MRFFSRGRGKDRKSVPIRERKHPRNGGAIRKSTWVKEMEKSTSDYEKYLQRKRREGYTTREIREIVAAKLGDEIDSYNIDIKLLRTKYDIHTDEIPRHILTSEERKKMDRRYLTIEALSLSSKITKKGLKKKEMERIRKHERQAKLHELRTEKHLYRYGAAKIEKKKFEKRYEAQGKTKAESDEIFGATVGKVKRERELEHK